MTTSRTGEQISDRQQPFAVRTRISGMQATVVLVVCLAIVVLSSAVAWDGDVAEWEADALRFFNDWPDWLEPIMWVLQQVGVLAGPLLGGIVIAWVARRWEYVIPFVLLMPLKLIIEKAVLKQLIERERPYVTIGTDINVRGPAFEGLSYPSGHTTTAFAFGILVAAFVPPKWRPLPLIWAVVVGVSRLYFGEHNILDVVAGAAMGTIFATILWFTILNRWVEPEPGSAA
jgi:undecaprenyl-diphosphatase